MRHDRKIFREVYQRLLAFYGLQGWWPVIPPGGSSPVYCGGPTNALQRLEVMVGALLAQNMSWRGARKALENLSSQSQLNFQSLLEIPEEKLGLLIRPSGYFNQKARRIKNLISFLNERYGAHWERFFAEPVSEMRGMLLGLNGIGPETADSIILYAAGLASFVIDSYTKRLFHRLGLTSGDISYKELKQRFEKALPVESELYNEYHALVVVHCKERCTARAPKCAGCALEQICARRGVSRLS
jgi:endonuclease-3 related protein